MSDLETEIAAEYGITIDTKEAGIDEPWNTDRGGIDKINAVSEGTGQVVAWLCLGLVFVFVADVIARKYFSSISWANDMGYFLYSIHFMIGSAFTLKRSGHIRTDFQYRKWGHRRQGITDMIMYGVFFIPALVLALWVSIEKGLRSFMQAEETITSNSGLPLWVLKVVLPIALFLWLLQSISELVKSIGVARTGEWQTADDGPVAAAAPDLAVSEDDRVGADAANSSADAIAIPEQTGHSE